MHSGTQGHEERNEFSERGRNEVDGREIGKTSEIVAIHVRLERVEAW